MFRESKALACCRASRAGGRGIVKDVMLQHALGSCQGSMTVHRDVRDNDEKKG
jgi:hypothetical protein